MFEYCTKQLGKKQEPVWIEHKVAPPNSGFVQPFDGVGAR